MKDEDLARARLRRQHLTGTPLATPEAVVGWLGAVQAQEFGVAKWSLAQRCGYRVTSAQLDQALAEGRIVRTHMMRGTWHFVLPADLRWMLALVAPRVRNRMAIYCSRTGLTDAVFARSHAVLREALAGGRQLVRKEVAAALARGGVAADGLKLSLLLMRAELDLVVCSGALRGKQQTFALLDERVPQAAPLSEDEALVRLTRRYFASHGPATIKDFIWWSSLTAGQARRGVELLKTTELRPLEAGGRTHWLGEAPARRATRETRVHLLQAYDEYIVGYTESRNVLAVAGGTPHDAPRSPNLLTRDGQVLGYWRTAPASKRGLDVHPSRRLDAPTRRALAEEVERYRDFVG